MPKRDYYDTLGVQRGASDSELKAAYRKLAMKHHPDRNPGDKHCEHRFKEVNEAYEVLKDPEKRAAYDRFGHAAFEHGMGGGGPGFGADFASTFADIFDDFFGMGRRTARGSGRERGADLRYNIEITPGGGLLRQVRPGAHPDLGDLRSLLGDRRQVRHQAEDLSDLRRLRQGAARARLLHARAHLPRPARAAAR